MSEVLVLVLAQPGSAAEDAAREARAQACPRPFEVRVVDAAGPPGAAIEAALQATSAPLVALLDASAPPEAGWLAALVAALDQDASLGAAAGSLGPGWRPSHG